MRPFLSKSQFLCGLQCRKSLWLHKYTPELATPPDESQKAIFETGTQVGILAQGLFPGGEAIAFEDSSFDEKLRRTQDLIQSGASTIYEATFRHDGVLVMVDILHRGEAGWEIYEVKSSTEVKDVHLSDLVIQYYVLAGSGLPVSKVCLVYINNAYVREGPLDIGRLFTIADLTGRVKAAQQGVEEEVAAMRAVLAEECPAIDIGPYCDEPYECEFKAHCWAHVPKSSVFRLYKLGKEKKFALYRQGIVELTDVPADYPLNRIQRLQVEAGLGREIVDAKGIRKFLATLRYPLYFLDFETVNYAVPPYVGLRPFEQIPFQYSLHWLDDEGADLRHTEFLAEPDADPREEQARRLAGDIPPNACVVAYNMSFERGVIKGLARRFPEHAERLMAIHDNMVDLIAPFRGGHFYTNDMNGSFSIKTVLPALVPELSYKGLAIGDGGAASAAYARLQGMEDATEKERVMQALREYCGLDTLAMVKVLEKLKDHALSET